eukprot:s1388_g9.t1
MDPLLSCLPVGSPVSLVARVQPSSMPDEISCSGLSPLQDFSLRSPTVLAPGVYTFYDLILEKGDPLLLAFSDSTAYHPQRTLDNFQKVRVFDVCSGMGGFALGSEPLGFETKAFLDSNSLACQTLRMNFPHPMIHGSVDDVSCVKELHAMQPDHFLQMTGGFPCQPFSRQGDLQGLRDGRGKVLPAHLRCAWLLRVNALLLECVDNVVNFDDIQTLLDQFAHIAEMHITKLVFDLQAQWPVRRNRFWCMMLTDSLPALQLQPWPTCHACSSLGRIMPFDAIWTEAHELDLRWDDTECAMFFDPTYGSDLRILLPQHVAPTMLHSWAHLLRSCPCGCRSWPLSLHRLRQGGARGFGITSAWTLQPRHLHPEEGALLCTVPLDFHFPGPPRTALSLLGQIAAPLQVMWLQAQLLAHLQEHFWLGTLIDPYSIIQEYKSALLGQRAQRWRLHSMQLPRHLTVTLDATSLQILVQSPTTAGELERAETALIGDGQYVIVTQHGHRLPPWSQLHSGEHYELSVIYKRQAKPTSSLMAHGLSLDLHQCHPQLPCLTSVVEEIAWLSPTPPAAVQNDWKLRYQNSTGLALAVYEHAGHWILLAGRSVHDIMHWRFYDGLSMAPHLDTSLTARQVAFALTQCLGLGFGTCEFALLHQQSLPCTCGTVALLNAATLLGIQHLLPSTNEADLHVLFYGLCTQASFSATGKNQVDSSLHELLISKGVPTTKVTERAKMIMDKLGAPQVQQIMKSSTPWSSLKAAASKPGKMFRLVTEEEQKDYVAQRASTKHGARISHAKQKKQASLQRDQPLQLDPDIFQPDAQHFQDDDEQPVKQIQFAEDSGITPIVFPAWCTTTAEHTLIMGHILQLGDSKVVRKMAGKESEPDKIDTQVVKVQIYKDQLETNWSTFAQAPVRTLLQMVDALQLCKGQNCGLECPKHHPDIDETLDAVILEVWSRNFVDANGKRADSLKAELFTVFLRLPASALHKVLTSLPTGIYAEPRGKQPREHDENYKVIWLPGVSYPDALHQCKTFAKSICLVRLKNKYGIRVRKCDEASAWGVLRPGVEFMDMTIQKIYELFPIPHGTQRQAINQILSDWSWPARALQPGKGNFHHMAWRIGSAVAPPAPVLTAFGSDVIITAVKDLQVHENKPQIYATAKTQKLLRDQPSSSTSIKPASAGDPWLDSDPWGGYGKITATSAPSRSTRTEEIRDQIRTDVQQAVKEVQRDDKMDDAHDLYTTENELRFVALESGLSELQKQNGQFLQWFQQTGDRMQTAEKAMQDIQTNVDAHAGVLQTMSSSLTNAEKAIGEVHQTLNTHQQELHSIGSNFKTAMRTIKDEISDEMTQSFNQQFNRLEALLEKRHKTS